MKRYPDRSRLAAIIRGMRPALPLLAALLLAACATPRPPLGPAAPIAPPAEAIVVPERYAVGHEAHFAQVTENFLRYAREGTLPAWEVPNMITKYATIMQAYEKSLAT